MELKPLFKDIADAIREKDGTTGQIKAANFPARIRALPAGGGDIELESITVAAPPAATEYQPGEFFDPAGLKVRAVYTNGAAREVTDYTVTPSASTPLTADDTKIVIRFTECGVTKAVEYPISVDALPPKKPLNDMTWADIRTVSDADLGAEYWNVGDRKGITIKGTVGTLAVNTTLYAYILGFNHNSAREGKGIQFGTFKTALSGGTDVCLVDSRYGYGEVSGTKYFNMNHWGASGRGGWKACDLRYDILGSTKTAPKNYGKQRADGDVGYDAPADTATSPVANTLMAALPGDLRAVMKPITKYSNNAGTLPHAASDISSSVDYLPLLSEYEIAGSRTNANQYEQNYQAQYAYYAAGNSKAKCRHSETDKNANWFARSHCINNSGFHFCSVTTTTAMVGNMGHQSCTASFGLAPVFMV